MGFPRLPALALLALLPTYASAVTFHVNDTADRPDDIQNGVCADAFGKCTLRAAIMEANLGPIGVGYVIELPAGTYKLTRAVTSPDDHSNGDLDVSVNSVTIQGAGAAKTIIDANHLDRAFKVAKSGYLILKDLTITNGQPSSVGGRGTDGGAVLANGYLELTSCVLDSNTSSGAGGAVAMKANGNSPSLIAVKTTFSHNVASGAGGGFYGSDVSVRFDACTLSLNAGADGGGIAQEFGVLYIQNSTLYQNDAVDWGGGIHVYEVTAVLYNVTLGGNGVDSNGDGYGSGGGLFDSHSTVTVYNSLFANLNDLTHANDDCSTFGTGVKVTFSEGNALRSIAGCTYTGFVYEQDPLLPVLKDNGGPTWTEMPPPSSIADGQGPVNGCTGYVGPLTEDQRGVKRPIGSACDLGAVELEPVGDVNGDGKVTVLDVFYLVNYLFAGGPVPLGRANVNGGSTVDVLDVFYLVNYLFAGGPAPI